MAWSLVRTSVFDLCFIRSSSTLVYLAPVYVQPFLTPLYPKESIFFNCSTVFPSNNFCKNPLHAHLRYLCSRVIPRKLCWEGSSRDILLQNLETCIKNHKLDEGWVAYTDCTKLYGLPDGGLLGRFITELSYSPELKWLQKACDIVISLSKKKSNMLHFDLLYNLSLSLARAQMPIPTSMILRIMIEKKNIPPANLLGPCVLHMVKKEIGAYLASNILIQIFDHREKLDITIFNLVLDACANHKLSFKAQKIIELMSQIGVVGDVYTIISIARIYVINGQRDELMKFKDCVDQVAGNLGHHYFQFYDSLMSLHFKFNDIDSASKLIFNMMSFDGTRKGPRKVSLIPLGSRNLREGLKLQVSPHLFLENSLMKVDRNEGFVMYKNGKLLISNKTIAKLVLGYKRLGRISELSKILNRIQTEYSVGMNELSDLSSDVIDACIHVGWLETAHDIIDDVEQKGNLLRTDSYALLLKAYYEGNKHREAGAFLNQMKKSGIILSDKPIVSSKRSDLITCFVQETRLGETNSSIYEFNSSIYFFMKAKMIDDALKAYKTMQRTKIHPNAATYIYMIIGYSSLEMYREIAILWGDIKRIYDDGNVSINIDLYEVLVLNFLKGGYFERVMEVISCMKKHGMYTDKWFYRTEFMKLHKDLYRVLKSSDARTEAQSKRLAHVKAFRKWADID